MQKTIFYNLFKNIASLYKGKNLLWQFFFIFLTFVLVMRGFDWYYFEATRGISVSVWMWAGILGFMVPVFLPLLMLAFGFYKKNKRTINSAYAIIQAGLLGLGVSSFYKVFTGRVGLPHIALSIDTSKIFQFGFLRGGAFQGWPSSHTSVAFAISIALFTLYPENKIIRYGAVIYALYIGIGASVGFHWFSDFVSGIVLGSMIGIVVGKSFLERYKMLV